VLSFETCKFLFDFFVLLSTFRNSGFTEVTVSRQKKETSFFVLLSTFRNSGFTEVTVSRQKKKQVSLFCSRLSVTLQHDLPT